MPNARDRQLDGLRAVAVSLVLYAHFLAAHDTYWGHVGVRLFFVLSGFLITRLLLDARSAPEFQSATALKSFYIRRALRIFPPYFAMLGFVWLVNLEQSKSTLLWHALYVSNFWYAIRGEWTPWLLCHTWSLSIEEQFYVVWPLIILLAPRRAIEQICVGAVVLSLAYRFCWPVTGPPSLARDLLPPASMDALASGAWLAAYRSRTAVWPRWMHLGWAPFVAAFLMLLWLSPAPGPSMEEWVRWIGMEVLPLVPLVMIVGYAAGSNWRLGRLLEQRPLVAVGTISYGIYLLHPIILSLMVKAQPWIPLNVSEQGPGRLLIGTTGTLMLAALSWRFFERPINAFKRYFPYVPTKGPDTARAFPNAVGPIGWLGREREDGRAAYLAVSVDRDDALLAPDLRPGDRS